MALTKQKFTSYLKSADFRPLFIEEMGWNKVSSSYTTLPTFYVNEIPYNLRAIAHRNGFQVLVCDVEDLPSNSVCKKLDTKLRKAANDYICIFVVTGTEHHQWVAPVKINEKRDLVIIEYSEAERAQFLFEKIAGISFGLDEETTIVDVKERVQSTFAINSEKITKDFYMGFNKEHQAFAEFITGIDDQISPKNNKNKQWYTSVMLNRLMFCYFIQKKGFLDGDENYLRNKLHWTQEQKGTNHFFKSFYRGFLIHLFHEGLNSPNHDDDFEGQYGRIPYLNGGMFDLHQLEKDYSDIDIKDEAFESLFDFFDKWRWHLDTRVTASGRDINPDVLGYIFEQYINDRAQMGAYYTKEDITEYIGRNTIIPYLLNAVAKQYPAAFSQDGLFWSYIKKSGDTYIYDAIKKGVNEAIPDEIEIGIDSNAPDLLGRRKYWNTATPAKWGLPTEIWRETINRHQLYNRILNWIECDVVKNVNDFITYNLDIPKIAYDFINSTEDKQFIKVFYSELQKVTILDPTCGSGAFLFAALNLLEPLYEVCITRMEEFHSQNSNDFKEQLTEIKNKYRSNIQYFIYKSIILRNLYGVDIMAEAVEIAKLRLFLKMVAVVDVDKRADNLGLDPLPDVDFNIRCGNTLVGYATEKQLFDDLSFDSSLEAMLANQELKEKLDAKLKDVADTYEIFRLEQFEKDTDVLTVKDAKKSLNDELSQLNNLLNRHLFASSGYPNYSEWLYNHQPFHWMAEFYLTMHGNGGFDVIIGNPPYVEYNKKSKETGKAISDLYSLPGYETLACGNLYAYCVERSRILMHPNAHFGMIVPLSLTCGDRMGTLRQYVGSAFSSRHISNFEIFPSKLFDGAFQRVSIIIASNEQDINCITKLHRWYSIERPTLFNKMSYAIATNLYQSLGIAKLQNELHRTVLERIASKRNVAYLANLRNSTDFIYYQEATNYWMKACMRIPYYSKNGKIEIPAHGRFLYFPNTSSKEYVFALLNSSLFYIWYSAFSDGFHLSDGLVKNFPINPEFETRDLCALSEVLEQSIKLNSYRTTRNTKTDNIEIESFRLNLSKNILDRIDETISRLYSFSEQELDFVINYDIKYRMGEELIDSD
jgi:hypothetical protein